MSAMIKTVVILGAALGLCACASTADSGTLPPAPVMQNSSAQLADTPVVTALPEIARTPPVATVKKIIKGDEIVIEAPVPVLSATMPDTANK